MRLKKIIIGLLLIGFVCSIPSYRDVISTAARLQGKSSSQMIMVIDPGHGGMDGGALGSDGTSEQKINLDIAKALQREAEGWNVKTVLTRETEDGLMDFAGSSGKWTKLGDMKERRGIIDREQPDLTISIHLNSFLSDPAVHGAQVFYPKEVPPALKEENQKLAETVQEALETQLPGSDDRIVLPKDELYLFREPDHLMILIECGFLSNSQDLQNLKNTAYQKKIAAAVMDAVSRHYGLTRDEKKFMHIIDSRTRDKDNKNKNCG